MPNQISQSQRSSVAVHTDRRMPTGSKPAENIVCERDSFKYLSGSVASILIMGFPPRCTGFANNITDIIVLNSMACSNWHNLFILLPRNVLCLSLFPPVVMRIDNKGSPRL